MKNVLDTVKKFWLMAALVGVMSIALAACGDNNNPTPANTTVPGVPATTAPSDNPAPTAATVKDSNSVSVVLKEWAISPSGIGLSPGKVKFTITNEGQFGHDLVIEGTDGKTPVFKSTDGPQSFTVDLKAGTYKWFCDLPGHADKGMTGTVTVK